MSDEQLSNAGVHLSLISDLMDGMLTWLERLNIFAAAGLVYQAWPEIEGDVAELVKDVTALIVKIKALT
jgi:hypothetical protein